MPSRMTIPNEARLQGVQRISALARYRAPEAVDATREDDVVTQVGGHHPLHERAQRAVSDHDQLHVVAAAPEHRERADHVPDPVPRVEPAHEHDGALAREAGRARPIGLKNLVSMPFGIVTERERRKVRLHGVHDSVGDRDACIETVEDAVQTDASTRESGGTPRGRRCGRSRP